jgi:antitoxin protein of toxin-antitoxin system
MVQKPFLGTRRGSLVGSLLAQLVVGLPSAFGVPARCTARHPRPAAAGPQLSTADSASIVQCRLDSTATPRRFAAHADWKTQEMDDFLNKAKQLADEHDEQVDQALERVGQEIDERTGNRFTSQIDKGVDFAQERTGEGDTSQ